MVLISSNFSLVLYGTLSTCGVAVSEALPSEDSTAKTKLVISQSVLSNKSNIHALYYETSNSQPISKKLKFVVINLSNSQIVATEFFLLNNIIWINDSQIEYLASKVLLIGEQNR